MIQLSIIIVNYNVRHFLEQALLSVRKAATGLSVEVFVVDNNSVDDSVEMVREKFPEVKLIANQDNPGFSKANNQAIRISTGQYVLLLNPDTVIEEDTLKKCVAFMDVHPDAGGLGVKMIDGSGTFLPESKRGFPSPFVAFCKTFGLSRLFPKSRIFNHYHLGYLDPQQTHEIEVLAGAFMLMRRSVLDEVGLLDEAFFMYGEDIDLSYRIVKAGYKNYYFADTTILHYKGESTKKGSLNYVRTFYQAMIIFARKHFQGSQANFFVLMLQFAIYFRASLTLLSNLLKKLYLPITDAALIFLGMYLLKNFWGGYYFQDPDYYKSDFLFINVPLYITIWLGAVFLSGGYDDAYSLRRLGSGIFFGTVLLAAVYGFLDQELRFSRVLIVLGAVWALLATIAIRLLIHFIRYKNFSPRSLQKNVVIVGSAAESERVLGLLRQTSVPVNYIGNVAPGETTDHKHFLSSLRQLDEVVHIYHINEIIFCSKNLSAQDIMFWMTQLESGVEFKIVPEESLSIIGSSSKDSSGELYTIDIRFNISTPTNRRNKRLFDLVASLILILISPVLLFFLKNKAIFFKNLLFVMLGKLTWVGYQPTTETGPSLPRIRKGVLTPLDGLMVASFNQPTIHRLNFLYAKDYDLNRDIDILWKGLYQCDRKMV